MALLWLFAITSQLLIVFGKRGNHSLSASNIFGQNIFSNFSLDRKVDKRSSRHECRNLLSMNPDFDFEP